MIEKIFKLKENKTNINTEFIAGLTTFIAMSYIIFLNPSVLSQTGMSYEAVFTATILTTVLATLFLGLYANVPYASSAGIGLGSLFTYTICGSLGYSWQEALAIVFICGLLNLIITLTSLRKKIISSIPTFLQESITVGIGLFITYVGLINAGIIEFNASSIENGIAQNVVPQLSNLLTPAVLVSVLGLVFTAILLVKKKNAAYLAGLRTNNKYSPYPEEMNRQMVDCMTDMYFAPTNLSKQNLLDENIDESKIYVTGNTAIDAMATTVKEDYTHKELEWVKENERLILVTAHRRENLGDPMRHIFKAIRKIVDEFGDVKVLYPIHLNPKVREVAHEIFDGCDRVRLIEPLEVFDFHNFINKSYIIMSDSGGVQEEAPSLGKPVLVLRDTTERPEGIDAGTLKLVGTDEKNIYKEAKILLTDKEEYERMSKASNPYGDGHASERIVDAIIEKYTSK